MERAELDAYLEHPHPSAWIILEILQRDNVKYNTPEGRSGR